MSRAVRLYATMARLGRLGDTSDTYNYGIDVDQKLAQQYGAGANTPAPQQQASSGVPTWAWVLGAGAVAWLLLGRGK